MESWFTSLEQFSVVRISCLKCTRAFLKVVMRAYWCQNGVFLINRPSELCALVFMNWNSSVWTWARVEIPLSVRCLSYSLLRMWIPHAIIACMQRIRLNCFIIKVSFLTICCLEIEAVVITSGRNSLKRFSVRPIAPHRTLRTSPTGLCLHFRRWCLDSCIRRHLWWVIVQ